MYRVFGWIVFLSLSPLATAQQQNTTPRLDGREGRDLLLRLYNPTSTLRVEQHFLKRARFPVVDVHSHFRRFDGRPDDVDQFVEMMDRNNMAVNVSLDGFVGDQFRDHKKLLWTKHRDRFVIFARIPWRGDGQQDDPSTWDCHRADFGHRMTLALLDAKQQGASGLKISKALGLYLRNPDGSLVKIDDPRWDPIWETCGRLGLPVLIHISDPAAFFRPINERNERWGELQSHPNWSFYGDRFPAREELLAARNRLLVRHPNTIFIGAHVGNNPEDLKTVGRWLDQFPNFHVELAARISDLGRQPYTTRRFIIQYAERVMFGTDGPLSERRMSIHWRFLETFDEYFAYGESSFPSQGYWNIYGLGLPEDVLKKVYYENASRIIPGVEQRIQAYISRNY